MICPSAREGVEGSFESRTGEEGEGQRDEDEGKGGNSIRYGAYHAACVVTHLFVVDEEAFDGAGLLHMFLDDCGNVVRQWRTDDKGEDFDVDGTWNEVFERRTSILGGESWGLLIVLEG